MKKTTLTVEAEFEVDPQDEEKLSAWLSPLSLSELSGKIWEIKEVSAPIKFRYHQTVIRGKIKVVQPNPFELKRAQLKDE